MSTSFRFALTLLSALVTGSILTGCSANLAMHSPRPAVGVAGAVHGGQQPVVGSTVQLYAVGTTGDGSAATPVGSPVVTDSGGNFDLTGKYSCPSGSTLVYLVATGGSPAPAITNSQIALMAALGQCGNLGSIPFVNVDEVTTVAAVYPLAPFMASFAAVGSGISDAAALSTAFVVASYYADVSTGTSPGPSIPPSPSNPAVVAQINTIADLVAACINTSGGSLGDHSLCGTFFALAIASPYTPTPTDTIGGLLYLAKNPSQNTVLLFNLIPPSSPFLPTDAQAPADFAIRIPATSAFMVSPSSVSFSPAIIGFSQPSQTITITNGTSSAVTLTTSIAGANSSDFSINFQAPYCNSQVAANSSCTTQIQFRPTAVGQRSAYFVIANSSANPSIAVPLSGAGYAGTAGPVTVSPSTLIIQSNGITVPVSVTNNGSGPLTIDSISVNAANYSQTNNCGSSLAGGASCTITVGWFFRLPTGPGTMTIYDDAAAGPQVVGLGNAGFPPAVAFGNWSLGATGSQLVPVSGNPTAVYLGLSITGANTSDFSFSPSYTLLSSSCSYSYRSGLTNCPINVYFTPTALGNRSANLNVVGFGQIPLTGIGNPAGVDFDVFLAQTTSSYVNLPAITALDYGSVVQGSSATTDIMIRNTGTVSTISVTPQAITGPNASDFSVTSSNCFGSPCYLVKFAAGAVGARSATLTFTDSISNFTRTIPLGGIGN